MKDFSKITESFIKRFLAFNDREDLFKYGETIVVSYSGGIDSAVLLDAFYTLAEQMNLTVIPAYFNHELRGEESREEELFIKRIIRKYGFTIETGKGEIEKRIKEKKVSLQESARYFRYMFLNEIAHKYSAHKIATGHHKDDQIETVFMRFLQGASYRGLRGIPVKREKFIRPLLWACRSEIEQYAENRSIEYFEDSTNRKTGYLRNMIRHEILPNVRKNIDINIDTVMIQQGKMFQELFELVNFMTKEAMEKCVITVKKGKIILEIPKFKNYFTMLKQNILFECFKNIQEIEEFHYKDLTQQIIELLNGTLTPRNRYISKGVYVKINGSQLIISGENRLENLKETIDLGKPYSNSNYNIYLESSVVSIRPDNEFLEKIKTEKVLNSTKWDELIDRKLLHEPFTLRYWNYGDWFMPLGKRQRKKLSDFFVDLKIPRIERKRIPILTDREKIVWICGLRIDDRVKVTKQTREIVCLKYDTVTDE